MKSSVVLFVLACVFFASVPQASALPKFASRIGAKCQACHVNPTGKGMRNTLGSTYGREELPMRTYKTVLDTSEDGKAKFTKEDVTNLEDFSTNLTPFFSYGADFRNLYFYDGKSKGTSFFQMQGDLYFDLRINKTFRVYLDKGLYSGFEVFGLAKVLPLDGYIKVGKFIPAYGMKLDDHNAYIRGGPYLGGPSTGLRFSQRSEDTGIELGIAPSIFTLNVGVFNGTIGNNSGSPDISLSKVVSTRGDATIQSDKVNFNFGGSFYNDPSSTSKAQFYGVFGSISAFKSLTLISEVDYAKISPTGKEVTGIAFYSEANYMIMEGVDAKVGYEFFDPDKDQQTGTYTRITVGAEFFVMSGVELRPLYRFNREKPVEVKNDEFDFMFHFFL